jgi:uncharacterized protein (DUF111 family)
LCENRFGTSSSPTTAIGLRETAVVKTAVVKTAVVKTALGRHEEVVQVRGQGVRIKVALDAAGRVVNVQPEYDDVATAAQALGVPVKQVLAEALAAAAHQIS